MEGYIHVTLAAGIIQTSSSPAARWVKKETTLHPCIDFWGLNNITVKNKYAVPLISAAFEFLQGSSFLLKLDHRNAYHLACIREGDE